MGDPNAGKKHAHKVVDARHRADSGTGIAASGLLFDGDRRRDPADQLRVGLCKISQMAPCVRGERFDIAALPFDVNRIEGK